MRTSSTTVNKFRTFEYREYELCDDPAFKAFAKKVEKLVIKTKRPMTRKEIGEVIGECPKDWLDTALDVWNTDTLEQVMVGGLMKFIKRTKPKLMDKEYAPMGISPRAFEQD